MPLFSYEDAPNGRGSFLSGTCGSGFRQKNDSAKIFAASSQKKAETLCSEKISAFFSYGAAPKGGCFLWDDYLLYL